MSFRVSICRLAIAIGSVLILAGCGQGHSSSGQAEDDRRPPQTSKYDVQVAKAETRTVPASDSPAPAAEPESQTDAPGALQEPAPLPEARHGVPLHELDSAVLEMPKVHLTQALSEKCRVQVGDSLPEVQLADLAGKEQSLSKLLGEKLTVVVFWNGQRASALEELADLGPLVLDRFGRDGVAVVAINSGDEPQLASELVAQAKAQCVNLTDRDGQALAQFTALKAPHTYLVDASGKVLWFDVEYSRTTRRDLGQAIRFCLAHP